MGDSLSFQFKDRSEESIYYFASYSGGDNLTLEKRKHERPERDLLPGRGIRIPKYRKLDPVSDPWLVFCANATFDDILWALLGERKPYNKDEADDWYTWDDEAFMEAIADNRDRLLYHPRALARYERIRRIAETGVTNPYSQTARKESRVLATRKKYKKMVNSLTPRHKGGRKDLPQGIGLARTLLKKLADQLSKECWTYLEDHLKGQRAWIGKRNALAGDFWRENYSILIEWGKVYKHRICKLDPEDLYDLIEKPKHYADELLAKTFHISLRTLNKR